MSHSTLVQQLLDASDSQGRDIDDMDIECLNPALRTLHLIACWQHDEITSCEDALIEYGDRFLQELEKRKLRIVQL
jgi:hypothetical protein